MSMGCTTFRYLEFVGDNLGNGYRYFIKFSFPIQKNALFYIYFQKILFYSLTPKIAKGTEIKKYTINEIPNIIMYGGRGPDFFIHKQEEKFNIQYEYKFF